MDGVSTGSRGGRQGRDGGAKGGSFPREAGAGRGGLRAPLRRSSEAGRVESPTGFFWKPFRARVGPAAGDGEQGPAERPFSASAWKYRICKYERNLFAPRHAKIVRRHAIFILRHAKIIRGYAIFILGQDLFILRRALFSTGCASFGTGRALFSTRQDLFIRRHAIFILGRASFGTEPDLWKGGQGSGTTGWQRRNRQPSLGLIWTRGRAEEPGDVPVGIGLFGGGRDEPAPEPASSSKPPSASRGGNWAGRSAGAR